MSKHAPDLQCPMRVAPRRKSVGHALEKLAARWRLVLTGLVGSATLLSVAEQGNELAKPSDLFQGTNVWKLHLKFTPDQWEAMEPQGGAGGFFGGPGPGGGRGPGGPGPM